MSSLTTDDVVALPKAELHLHLEGALRPATATELADRYGLPLPSRGPFDGLGEFVVAYERARNLVGTLDDLRRVARELVEDAAARGVVWSEVHVVPPTYAGRLGAADGVLEAVLDGFRAGASASSAAGVVLGVNRGLGTDAAEESLRLAVAYRDQGVLGLGLAGDEANHPADRYADLFARARAAGLRALPHGGEAAGPESVRACVEQLGADRVEHGVRAVEDPSVVQLLVDRQVCLDICPTSNVALQVAPSLAEHPLPVLLNAGVPFTLNSDCPLFFGSPVTAEYLAAASTFRLDDATLAAVAGTSLTASSCPADRRHTALTRIDAWRAHRG